jgi:hypothetical protein
MKLDWITNGFCLFVAAEAEWRYRKFFEGRILNQQPIYDTLYPRTNINHCQRHQPIYRKHRPTHNTPTTNNTPSTNNQHQQSTTPINQLLIKT